MLTFSPGILDIFSTRVWVKSFRLERCTPKIGRFLPFK